MKKVLIITYAFPPSTAVGARRPFGLAKYLPQFGWEPIILTPKWPGRSSVEMRVIETDYKDVIGSLKSRFGFRSEKGLHEQLGIALPKNYDYSGWRGKSIKLSQEIIAYPDAKRGWSNFAVKAASELLNTEKVDAIISTSPPIITHLIAMALKQRYEIPWAADLRDLWTQNHYYNKFKIIKHFEKRLELRTLSGADVLVTANPLVDTIKALHRDKEIVWITNGYDADDYPEESTRSTDKFTITYTGTLYDGKRDPAMLFEVVKQLIEENTILRDRIQIRFLGPNEAWLDQEIKKCNLNGTILNFGGVSREDALKMQRESQILLLLLWKDKEEENILPGKIFEYLGARRPVIAYGPEKGAAKDLLEATNAGKFVGDANSLRSVIVQYYREFLETGRVKCESNSYVENFTYKTMALRYAGILNRLVEMSALPRWRMSRDRRRRA